jgi:catechol 2,3-dioxygenase-like lactoylglutathione lyase family enzyme
LAEGIDAQRVDFIAVPVQDRERATRFYEETLGPTNGAVFTDSEGNGLAVHGRYASYADGTT